MTMDARLYGIVDLKYVAAARVGEMTREMIAGGVGVIQLRAKAVAAEAVRGLAGALAPVCAELGVPFIVNDYRDLVAGSGAAGVHVGQDDWSVAEARRLAGPGAVVGKSTHSLEQAVAAQEEGADYIGFGPVFATPTKPDYAPIGLAEIRAVHAVVRIPIFCIGGIKRENVAEVAAAGARRVVVVSGILTAADPAGYCREVLAGLG